MLIALIIMMREFMRMTMGNKYRYSQLLTILSGATLFTLIYLYKGCHFPGRLVILAFIPIFIVMINSLYVKDKTSFGKFANLYTAILYIAVPWSMLNFAVFDANGVFNGILLLCFFCIIWVRMLELTHSAWLSVRNMARSCSHLSPLRNHGSDSGAECLLRFLWL